MAIYSLTCLKGSGSRKVLPCLFTVVSSIAHNDSSPRSRQVSVGFNTMSLAENSMAVSSGISSMGPCSKVLTPMDMAYFRSLMELMRQHTFFLYLRAVSMMALKVGESN